jgi:UDP-N-acetylmuramate: L-alanyl-gamma-D-glutamyl-meso-diaminopimelate ligase
VPDRPETIHLIGICGTGMAGLACMLKDLGHHVTGSDENIYPPMSGVLERAGIEVAPFHPSNVARQLDCIVLGAGVARANSEAVAAVGQGHRVCSYPEALARYVLDGRDAHVVAGTHGKTTTASMLAWIHETAGRRPGFFIGGLPRNFGVNAKLPDGGPVIVEGDEFKSSNLDPEPKFLKYRPHLAIVTNIEFDHADVFVDFRAVVEAFAALTRSIDESGVLITSVRPALVEELRRHARCRVITVGRDPGADWQVTRRREHGAHIVEVRPRSPDATPLGPFALQVAGAHNADNAAIASVAAHSASVGNPAIIRAMESFAGVTRRLDIVKEIGGVRLIDDFAHHPTEVAASISALKECNPERCVWAIFEPRSTTSRRPMFQDDYCRALGLADRVTIAVARPWPDGARTLDSATLAKALCRDGVHATVADSTDVIVDEMCAELGPETDVLVMSSGPFDGLVGKVLRALAARG